MFVRTGKTIILVFNFFLRLVQGLWVHTSLKYTYLMSHSANEEALGPIYLYHILKPNKSISARSWSVPYHRTITKQTPKDWWKLCPIHAFSGSCSGRAALLHSETALQNCSTKLSFSWMGLRPQISESLSLQGSQVQISAGSYLSLTYSKALHLFCQWRYEHFVHLGVRLPISKLNLIFIV